MIELTSSNAGSPGCVYGGTWLELSDTIQRGRGEVVAVPLDRVRVGVVLVVGLHDVEDRRAGVADVRVVGVRQVAGHRDHRAHAGVATAVEEPDAERHHLAVGVTGGGDAVGIDEPAERVALAEAEHLGDHERRVTEGLLVVDVAGAAVGAAQDREHRRRHDVARPPPTGRAAARRSRG